MSGSCEWMILNLTCLIFEKVVTRFINTMLIHRLEITIQWQEEPRCLILVEFVSYLIVAFGIYVWFANDCEREWISDDFWKQLWITVIPEWTCFGLAPDCWLCTTRISAVVVLTVCVVCCWSQSWIEVCLFFVPFVSCEKAGRSECTCSCCYICVLCLTKLVQRWVNVCWFVHRCKTVRLSVTDLDAFISCNTILGIQSISG